MSRVGPCRSKPIDGTDRRRLRVRSEKHAKGSGYNADEAVAMAWERLVGREYQTPVRLAPSMRLRIEGQVVLYVLSHDAALEVLSSGEQGGSLSSRSSLSSWTAMTS